MQFCIFLKALLGEVAVGRLMAEAVAVAKREKVRTSWLRVTCSP
jgi:hypothetical protein